MPQSLAKVLIHIIFSTKNRVPWLKTGKASRCDERLPCRRCKITIARQFWSAPSRTMSTSCAILLGPSRSPSCWKKSRRRRRRGSKRRIPRSASFIGKTATAPFPSARQRQARSSNTSPARKSIIASCPFRMSFEGSWNVTASNTTNVTCGTKRPLAMPAIRIGRCRPSKAPTGRDKNAACSAARQLPRRAWCRVARFVSPRWGERRCLRGNRYQGCALAWRI